MSLDNEIFQDETKAREYLESIRWPNGPICPHCGSVEKMYTLKGEAHRPGLYKCAACRKQFSVTVGTLFERSHIPLHKWLMAVHLLCASKKGHSSHQIHRMLGVTYKTAWFMTHRIREAMKDPVFTSQLGGGGGIVEADETYLGPNNPRRIDRNPRGNKEKIFSLVERDGKVRSFHIEAVRGETLKPIMREQIAADTHIMTDQSPIYHSMKRHFLSHESVNHNQNEYVRGRIHTNTIEGYFSILKRGLRGIYQHVGKQHLRRYIGEFDFRYNTRKLTDAERTALALKGIDGKRLLYTRPW
jgi:transposase-like protein